MTKRNIGIGAGILALVAALWLAFSPYLALNGIRNAVEARDAEALNSYVDYEAVRANLKEQVSARIAKEMATGKGNAAGAAMAAAFINPMIDAMVQPTMITAMLAGDKAKDGPKAKVTGEDVVVQRTGLTSFLVTDKEGKSGAIFEMRGLGWKMVGLKMPE